MRREQAVIMAMVMALACSDSGGQVPDGGLPDQASPDAAPDLHLVDLPVFDSTYDWTEPPDTAPPPVKLSWVKLMGRKGGVQSLLARPHPAGGMVLAGSFQGEVDLGGIKLTSKGGVDIFLARLDGSGKPVWSRSQGGSGGDWISALAVDKAGNVTVAGSFNGAVSLGGASLTIWGNSDVFVARYTAGGKHAWSRGFGGPGFDSVDALAVDGKGDVVFVGSFDGSATFGGTAPFKGSHDVYMARLRSDGKHHWSRAFIGSGWDFVMDVALDSAGEITMAGSFGGQANFGGKTFISAGSNDAFVARYKSNGVHLWSRGFGGSQKDLAQAVAMDSAGNVTLAGYFQGSVNLGGAALTSKGGTDAFLARYDKAGKHVWSRAHGGASNDLINALTLDSNGDIVAAGAFTGATSFGGGAWTNKGSYDAFLARYDKVGKHVWSKAYGGPGDEYVAGVAVNKSGDITVTGAFSGSVGFGGKTLASAGETDSFLVQYKAGGQHLQSRAFAGLNAGKITALASDKQDNIVAAGVLTGSLSFGGAALATNGSTDLVAARYSSGGKHLMSAARGGVGKNTPAAVAVASNGDIVVAGSFKGSASVGGKTLVSKGDTDIFLARYKGDGKHLWSRSLGGNKADTPRGVVLDSAGNITLAGDFKGSASFGGKVFKAAFNRDVFIAQYKPGGAHAWSEAYGGKSADHAAGVAADSAGNLFVAGQFKWSASFGGTTFNSTGQSDGFLARYSPAGKHLWSTAFGGTGVDSPELVAADSAGNVTVAGVFDGSSDFGGPTMFTGKGGYDLFLARYTAAGQFVWGAAHGGWARDYPHALALDSTGAVTVTGEFEYTTNLGGQLLTSNGKTDVFVARYSTTGAHLWSRSFGSPYHDDPPALTVDSKGRSTVAGLISGVVDFGLGKVTTVQNVYLAQFAP